MPETNVTPNPRDLDEAVRVRILVRAGAINTKLLSRLTTVAKDLEEGSTRDALLFAHQYACFRLESNDRRFVRKRNALLFMRADALCIGDQVVHAVIPQLPCHEFHVNSRICHNASYG